MSKASLAESARSSSWPWPKHGAAHPTRTSPDYCWAAMVTPDTEELGKAAGAICGRAGTSDVIDGLVVVTALRLDALVVTSDS
jgi:hypothetical protein